MNSKDLVDKSVQAAVAAIEIYNKPAFRYREEAFALLMVNAWELLLKAKWLADHKDEEASLYSYSKTKDGGLQPKLGRSGNPITHSCTFIVAKLVEDKNSGVERACSENINALVEIRDNAAHLINKDARLGRRILEVGTASLRNFVSLAREWFQIDLAEYNFFLMPLSFYREFDVAEALPITAPYAAGLKNLLTYLDSAALEAKEVDDGQSFSLAVETKLVRSKDAGAVEFRFTDDPQAAAISVREEDVLKSYPLTFRKLADAMKKRYSDFSENRDFHKLRKELEKEKRFAIVRMLDPNNPRSSKQRFYSALILQEFDKTYARRQKSVDKSTD